MEILGVGPLELLLIFIIALVVLGPRDMVKAGRSIGRFLRRTILSPTWLKMQREIRNLPYQMMREAGLEDQDLSVKKDIEEAFRRNPVRPNNFVTEYKKEEPVQSQTGPIDGIQPPIPPEWLGTQFTAISSSEDETPTREGPYIEDWTSAPTKVASQQNPRNDKEAD